MPLKQYDAIRLKPAIQQTLHDEQAIEEHPDRTPERDKAAAWLIHSDAVDLDDWGNVLMTDLEDVADKERDGDGWSRQHLSNVVQYYFEGVADSDGRGRQGSNDQGISRTQSPMSAAPEDVTPQQRPAVTPAGKAYVAVVEDGQLQRVSEVPIPDNIDDVETYLQGVFTVASDL